MAQKNSQESHQNNSLLMYFEIIKNSSPLSAEEEQELIKVVRGLESQLYPNLDFFEARKKLLSNSQLRTAVQQLYPQYNYFLSSEEREVVESIFLERRSIEETVELFFYTHLRMKQLLTSVQEKFAYLQAREFASLQKQNSIPHSPKKEPPSWYTEAKKQEIQEKSYSSSLEKYASLLHPLEKTALNAYLKNLSLYHTAQELSLPQKITSQVISLAKKDLEFIVQAGAQASSLYPQAAVQDRYSLLLAKYGELLTPVENKIIKVHYVLGRTISEAAQEIGISSNHVRAASFKAKKKLRYLGAREKTLRPASKDDPLWYQKATNFQKKLREKYSFLLIQYGSLLPAQEARFLELRGQNKLLKEIAFSTNLSENYVSLVISKAEEHLDFLVEREKSGKPVSKEDPLWYQRTKNYGEQQAEYERQLLKEQGEKISKKCREILTLKYEEHFSNLEIAERMNLPPNTIRTRLSQARKKLNLLRKT